MTWEACFAVWEVIMLMLRCPPDLDGDQPAQVLTPIVIETYLEAFRQLCKEHPECWHLCQKVEDRWRIAAEASISHVWHALSRQTRDAK